MQQKTITENDGRPGIDSPSGPVPFIGGLGLTGAQVLDKPASNNAEDWFAGSNVHYVYAARTAIRKAVSLLNLRPGDEVLVPSYHCGSELDALLHAGVEVRLFQVSANGEIDVADLRRRLTPRTKAVYVIHYFGFPQPLGPVADLCRGQGLHLIEDCALSTFTAIDSRRLGSVGDVAVYNFPKALPVPDGGALVINNRQFQLSQWPLRRPGLFTTLIGALRLLKPGLLRSAPWLFRDRAVQSPAQMENGLLEMPRSYYFDPSMMDRDMSGLSHRVIKRVDATRVRNQRRRNFAHLLDRLSGQDNIAPLFRELPSGVCPLSFPVVMPGARDVARRLRALSIPAVAWWSGYHRARFDWAEFAEARRLKDSIVALPVHQQLDDRAMEFIARAFVECSQ